MPKIRLKAAYMSVYTKSGKHIPDQKENQNSRSKSRKDDAMNDMRSKFESHIWQRGVEYYREGRVGPFEKTDQGYRVTVCGTEDYTVDVFMDRGESMTGESISGKLTEGGSHEGEGKVVDMECDCPYAEGGEYCKHMAAALIAMEEASEGMDNAGGSKVISFDDEKAKRQEEFIRDELTEHDMEQMVLSADRDELELFLISEMESDPELARRFRVFVTDIVSSPELDMYRMQLDDIFDSCEEDGYVSYYMADELEDWLCDFIEKVICRTFMRYGKYDDAFMLTARMLEKLSSTDIDDSNGIIVGVTYRAIGILNEIAAECSDILKARMFEWVTTKVEKDSHDYVREELREFWQKAFTETAYLERKMAVIKDKLETLDKTGNEDGADRYDLASWIEEYYIVAEATDVPTEDIRKIERKYWRVPEVRQHAADRLITDGKPEEAIEVLKESRKIDEKQPGLVYMHTKRLAELYGMIGDDEKRRAELITLVTDRYRADMDEFRKLKACYSGEEWPAVRDAVLEKMKERPGVERFYCEEKLYDRLLKSLQERSGSHLIEEYASVLKEDYPEETLALYEMLIRKEAEFTGGRKHYKKIVKLMRKMKRLPGGRESVMRIADDFRSGYRQRSAMMDELDRL